MTTTKRITTAIATGAILLNALAPVAFAQTITVTGNGAVSNNSVNVSNNNTVSVNQTNVSNITNNVNSTASTGNNTASYNTGGDTKVVTGNATSNTTVNNAANLNQASVTNCGACNGGATNVTVSDNGALSDNGVNVTKGGITAVSQTNVSNLVNNIDAKTQTGGNDAGFNTGGNTTVNTGAATTTVNVSNAANANMATIGGGSGTGAAGSSVTISGNGALSTNGVNLTDNSAVVLAQANVASVVNNIDAKAKTGNNTADFNTGGTTTVDTGDAKTNVGVHNLVNFNAADVDCGCTLNNVDAKIAGNGYDSMNGINLDSGDALFVSAANVSDLGNNVDGKSKTGNNSAEFGTGATNGDPSVHTGDANSTTNVTNSGEVNLYGNGVNLHLPGDWDLGLHFDLSGLLGFLPWSV